jgi:glycyl-tRNA synthetase
VSYDDTGGIGKLYRRQDEIGTPFCITIDFDTIEKDNAATVRERDGMTQTRVPLGGLADWLSERLA